MQDYGYWENNFGSPVLQRDSPSVRCGLNCTTQAHTSAGEFPCSTAKDSSHSESMAQVDARRLIPFGKHGTVDTHASVIKRKHPQGALSFSAPNVLSPCLIWVFFFWLENRFGRPRYLRFDFKWTVMRLEVRLESDQWLDQNYVIEFESNSNPNLGSKTPRNKNTHEFFN